MTRLVEHQAPPAPVPVDDDLERLWAAPAASSAGPGRLPRDEQRASRLGLSLTAGWIALVVASTVVGERTGAAEIEPAAWVGPAALVMVLLLGIAALSALELPRLAYGFSALAAGIALAFGIECRVSAHHLGAWWMVETAAATALVAASVAGVARRARR